MNILADGDSWFKYPKIGRSNIIEWLQDDFDIKNMSSNGDEAGAILSGKQKIKICKELGDSFYDAFLFSGGGNDFMGENDMDFYIDENGIRHDLVDNKLLSIKHSMIDMIERIDSYSMNKDIQIFTHCYDFIEPSGKGFKFLGFTLAGPWVKPYLVKHGITDYKEQKAIIVELLTKLKSMYKELESEYPNFHLVDTHGLLNSKMYADEAHPSKRGFRIIAESFKAKINSVCL